MKYEKLLAERTPQQAKVILKGIRYLQGTSDEFFSMAHSDGYKPGLPKKSTSLAEELSNMGLNDGYKPKKLTNLAEAIIWGSLGRVALNNYPNKFIISTAAVMIGITGEAENIKSVYITDLLLPTSLDADYRCINKEAAEYITLTKAIRALWWYYNQATVIWNKDKLKRYIQNHPVPRINEFIK